MFSLDLLKYSFKKTIPVLIGYFFLGIGFGILLEKSGLGLLECLIMSIFIFSGSMQYAGISLLSTGASLITTFITTLIVNARYFFYALSLVGKYKDVGKKKLYLIHSIVDEGYALISENDYLENEKEEDYWFLISFLDHLYWIISTLIGVYLGSLIKIEIKGIDFVMTALFMTIFVDQWLKNKDHFPSFIGLLITLISLLILGNNNFLLPAIIIITIISAIYKGDKNE